MRQAENIIGEGVHPRHVVDGLELGKLECLRFLDTFKIEKEMTRDLLIEVARTSLNTKIIPALANPLTEIIVDAVNCIKVKDKPIDLHMVEIMHM